jgi:hypothetical protein
MCLGAEIGLFILGVYWLVTGKAKVNETQQLVGMHVRMMVYYYAVKGQATSIDGAK